MKKSWLMIFLILLVFSAVQSSNFSRKIELSYLDFVHELAETKDDGYIIEGICDIRTHRGYIPFLIKFNQDDSLIWIKVLQSLCLDTSFISICSTEDTGCAIATRSDIFDTITKIILIKFDKSGRIQWTTEIIFPDSIAIGRFPNIAQLSDKGFIIVAPMLVSSRQRIGVFKFDSTGMLEYSKAINAMTPILNVKVIPEIGGKFTIAFRTCSSTTMDIILAQLSPTTRAIRTRKYSFTVDIKLSDLKKTSDGGYIVAGKCRDAIGYWNLLLMKVDSILTLNWVKRYGINRTNLSSNHVIQTTDGGYLIAGQLMKNYSIYEFIAAKFDAIGNLVWAKIIEDSLSSAVDVMQKPDSSILIIGRTTKYARDVQASMLVKFEKSGYNCLAIDTTIIPSIMSPSISLGTVRTETILVTSSHPTIVDTTISYIDSLICYSTRVADEKENPSLPKIIVYPNPFNNVCVISAPNSASIEIFDISGKRIAHFRRSSVLWKPDEKLGSGVYLVRIRLRNGKTLTYRAFFIR